MARYGMLINTKKCIGCYACRVACQRQNNLLPTEDFIRYERGTYPNVPRGTAALIAALRRRPAWCAHRQPPISARTASWAWTTAAASLFTITAWRFARRDDGRGGQVPLLHGFGRDDGREDVLVRGGLPDGGAYVRRSGRPGQRHLEGDRRDERAAYRGRPDQVQSILREVMNDDV